MDVRVNFEFLRPGVQDAEEADFCTEMLGIARNFEKGFGTGAKQEIRRGPSCSAKPRGPDDGEA
jgi:hypothetical protein